MWAITELVMSTLIPTELAPPDSCMSMVYLTHFTALFDLGGCVPVPVNHMFRIVNLHLSITTVQLAQVDNMQ